MMNFDPISLPALLSIAAGTGVLHTLVGTDHYLPLAAIGRERAWSPRRLAMVTAAFGLLHCAASIGIVVVILAAFESAFGFAATAISDGTIAHLTKLAALLVIGTGVALMHGARRRRRNANTERRGKKTTVCLLALAFLIGPCEFMLPIALAAGGEHGMLAALQVSVVFSVCTVTTMVVATSLAAFGLSKLGRSATADLLAGGLCATSGLLMLIGF